MGEQREHDTGQTPGTIPVDLVAQAEGALCALWGVESLDWRVDGEIFLLYTTPSGACRAVGKGAEWAVMSPDGSTVAALGDDGGRPAALLALAAVELDRWLQAHGFTEWDDEPRPVTNSRIRSYARSNWLAAIVSEDEGGMEWEVFTEGHSGVVFASGPETGPLGRLCADLALFTAQQGGSHA